MKTLRQIWMLMAAVGFIFSLMIHVFALSGRAPQSDVWIALLFGGTFVLWIPGALLSGMKGGHMGAIPVGEIVRGCPKWLKKADYFLFSYAVLIFLWGILRHFGILHLREGRQPSPETFGIFSGWCMAFYAGVFSMLFGKLSDENQLPITTPD
jgi:hypothetical protein